MANDLVVHLIDDDEAVRQAIAFLLHALFFEPQLPMRSDESLHTFVQLCELFGEHRRSAEGRCEYSLR